MKKSLLSNELFCVQLGEILRILHDITTVMQKKSQGPSSSEQPSRTKKQNLEMDRNSATSLLQYDDTKWRQIKKETLLNGSSVGSKTLQYILDTVSKKSFYYKNLCQYLSFKNKILFWEEEGQCKWLFIVHSFLATAAIAAKQLISLRKEQFRKKVAPWWQLLLYVAVRR